MIYVLYAQIVCSFCLLSRSLVLLLLYCGFVTLNRSFLYILKPALLYIRYISVHLTLSMLGKNSSRRHFDLYFFLNFFSQKKKLFFFSFGDNLHERSSLFPRRIRKYQQFVVCCIRVEIG